MFKRILNLPHLIERKSFFLMGPRLSGKTTLLKSLWPKGSAQALYLDLLESRLYRQLTETPEVLPELFAAHLAQGGSPLVIIDEIQLVPQLLNEVHNLIESSNKNRFILTGSSARKLKRASANLLGGRAGQYRMHPLVYPELLSSESGKVDLHRRIQWGGLPRIYMSDHPKDELQDYVGLYLQQEITDESAVRSVGGFSRFLTVAALCNTEQVIFSSVASDAGVKAREVREYFQILEDTLMGALLPAFGETKKRKAMVSPKFYYFDTGVTNSLLGRWNLQIGTPEYGKSFEHYIYCELTAALDYMRVDWELSYWRSTSQLEVDFILKHKSEKKLIAIEAKGISEIDSKDMKGLLAFSEDFPEARRIIVYSGSTHRLANQKVEIIPLEQFLKMLWEGEILSDAHQSPIVPSRKS